MRVVRTIAKGLDVPWGIALLPAKKAVLLTQRNTGKVTRVDIASGRKTLVGRLPSHSTSGGEDGALGLALSPGFASDHRVYFYYSTASDNRIAWATYRRGHHLGRLHVVLRGIPHGTIHNGGRIAFGPDGRLYVGTGETGNKALAQNKKSLGGKILRLTKAGTAAKGNPFGTRIWTFGHRNVQGLAFDPAGRLWASEFGESELDELNLIKKGHNYGWPATQGKNSNPRYTNPVAQWGTSEDSPSGIAWAGGAVWMAALQGQRLWRIPLDGAKLAASRKPSSPGGSDASAASSRSTRTPSSSRRATATAAARRAPATTASCCCASARACLSSRAPAARRQHAR